jgi:hypothetical protein
MKSERHQFLIYCLFTSFVWLFVYLVSVRQNASVAIYSGSSISSRNQIRSKFVRGKAVYGWRSVAPSRCKREYRRSNAPHSLSRLEIQISRQFEARAALSPGKGHSISTEQETIGRWLPAPMWRRYKKEISLLSADNLFRVFWSYDIHCATPVRPSDSTKSS